MFVKNLVLVISLIGSSACQDPFSVELTDAQIASRENHLAYLKMQECRDRNNHSASVTDEPTQPDFCNGQCKLEDNEWNLEVSENPTSPHEGCERNGGCVFTPNPGGGGVWYFGEEN